MAWGEGTLKGMSGTTVRLRPEQPPARRFDRTIRARLAGANFELREALGEARLDQRPKLAGLIEDVLWVLELSIKESKL